MAKQRTSLAKEDIKVVLLEGIHSSAEQVFRNDGYNNIFTATKSLPDAELKAEMSGAKILGIRSRTQVTTKLIGTNQVDLVASTKRGIPVFNAKMLPRTEVSGKKPLPTPLRPAVKV